VGSPDHIDALQRALHGTPLLLVLITHSHVDHLSGWLTVNARWPGASMRTTVLTVLALTWLNPHVYLDTVLLLGTMATPYPTWGRATFAAGGSLASALWFLTLGFGSRWLAPLFASPGAWRVLDGVTAATMMALAAMMVLS